MERLTEKHYLGTGHYMKCSGSCNVDMDCIDCPSFDCLVERLAAYEDTGLTPGEVHSTSGEWRTMMSVLNSIGGGYDRLRDLAEADKDGRLVVLPCKVGDRLYEVTGRKTISVYKVRAIRVELFGLFIAWDIVEGFVWQSLAGINAGEIGKTVFLTREEAEKARLFVGDGVRVICSKCYAGTMILTDNMECESNAVETVVESWNRRADNGNKESV